MPNGFHGTQEWWEDLARPLREIDGILEDFARSHDMTLSKDARNWPARSLRWGADIRRSILIAVADEKAKTYGVGVAASKDVGGRRYWRSYDLTGPVSWAELRGQIERLLEQGYRIAESWREKDLRPT